MSLTRRVFIRQTASAAALVGAGLWPDRRLIGDHAVPAGGFALTFPPELEGGTLEARPAIKEVWPGFPTPVLAFNGSVPGPTVRIKRGDRFQARVTNSLEQPLVVHWHGILAPSSMDGNPRDAVPAGGAYSVDFAIDQPAGTYWYHAHTDRLTGKQVYQGLAGFFIVEDPAEEVFGLPKGEFELPLLLQDRLSDPGHTLAYPPTVDPMGIGLLGDSTTVNGVPNASLSVARSLYRLRLLNGSNARVLRVGLGEGAPFQLIANDGGLLAAPIEVTSLFLAPGNRAEILVNFGRFTPGSTVELKTLAFTGDLTMGSSQGLARTLMRFVVQHIGIGGAEPASLAPSTPHVAGDAKRTRSFVITMPGGGRGGGHGMGMTADLINGLLYEMNRTDFTVPYDELEIWEFHNLAQHLHPLHAHGVLFQVASRSTSPAVPPEDMGWKDTVLVRPGEIVRTLVKFDAHPGAFVLHCHNLEHEDRGMMLNFDVAATTPPVEGPRLQVRHEAGEIVVTAPPDSTEYRLERSATLGHGASWTPVRVAPIHATNGLEFRLPSDGTAQFFRLSKS